MTWFKIDDSFYRSRKVRKLGRDRVPAVGLWTLCGDWSADNLTDGFVPWEVVEDWDPSHKWAERLIDVGLWSKDSDDGEHGIRFHDWHDWQPTKSQVMSERRYNARKSALYRDPELVDAVRKRDRDRCRYCGAKVNWKDRRSASGGTYDNVAGDGPNTLENVVVACRDCSSRKGDRPLSESGMQLLEPGAMARRSRSSQVSNQHSSSSYLDTNQISSRTFQDPDPTRPDPTLFKEQTPPLAPLAASDDQAFAEFYAAYPRKEDRRSAERAWKRAMKAKADPQQVVAAARRYAEQTRETERRFIKLPATWLNAGAYDNDESSMPQLRAVSGGYQPYRNPADPSVWDEPLLPPNEGTT